MRENCTSGSVRGGGSNAPTYSAFEATDFGEQAGEGIGLCQVGEIAEEAQPARIMGHSQFLQEAAAKQARQHAHG